MSESSDFTHEQWWFASLSDTMFWARLRVLESGAAEVFDAQVLSKLK